MVLAPPPPDGNGTNHSHACTTSSHINGEENPTVAVSTTNAAAHVLVQQQLPMSFKISTFSIQKMIEPA